MLQTYSGKIITKEEYIILGWHGWYPNAYLTAIKLDTLEWGHFENPQLVPTGEIKHNLVQYIRKVSDFKPERKMTEYQFNCHIKG